jgi:hypothetical protein
VSRNSASRKTRGQRIIRECEKPPPSPTGEYNRSELAEKYGLSVARINQILQGRV